MPPQDVAAERAVLGSMLISQDAVADVIEAVGGGDFYQPAHETIFEAIIELFGHGVRPDVLTVADELNKRGELTKVGGATYLNELTSGVRTAANSAYHGKIVAERAMLRRLIDAGTRIVQLGYAESGGDPIDLVNLAQAEMYSVADRNAKEDYVSVGSIIKEALDEIEAAGHFGGGVRGIATGFRDLDQLTSGLHAGQMVVIAARPGLGKSTLALDFARTAAIKDNRATVLFSLEMPKMEILQRLLSAESEVKLAKMRSGGLNEDDWMKIHNVQDRVAGAPLYIDDSANLSLMEIRAKARRLKQQCNLELIIIDYLQLMISGKSKVESRQQEVSEFSRSLKLLAKELEVPVVALSQLNRGPEQRADKRPALADLRESGSIEQDADVVILLHRDSQDEDRGALADMIIAKHRNGATGVIPVLFRGHIARFDDATDVEASAWGADF
ncbi:MAG: replicative DNA helicase [Promicromonosporaceae bacterium]|nr:replicative DNA helicase [Promicromonosporaceae bacterium]